MVFLIQQHFTLQHSLERKCTLVMTNGVLRFTFHIDVEHYKTAFFGNLFRLNCRIPPLTPDICQVSIWLMAVFHGGTAYFKITPSKNNEWSFVDVDLPSKSIPSTFLRHTNYSTRILWLHNWEYFLLIYYSFINISDSMHLSNGRVNHVHSQLPYSYLCICNHCFNCVFYDVYI